MAKNTRQNGNNLSAKSRNEYGDNYAYSATRGKQPQSKNTFEDVSSYSNSTKKRPKKKMSTGKKIAVAFLSVLFSLLILAGAGLIYVSTYLLSDLTTTTLTKDPAELGISEDIVSDGTIKNIALFGLDSRGNDFSGRSDAIMIMSVDQKHNKIKLISVLRDSYLNLGYGGYEKAAHAYAYGGATQGIRMLNMNFNLDIRDYVSINFGNLAEVIDAVGGVDVQITESEMYHINMNLDGLAGEQPELGITNDYHLDRWDTVHLNGHQAVAYARIRKTATINGTNDDFGRVERQQIVLQALFNRVLTMNKLEYPAMIKNLTAMCETSMDFNDILPLAKVALSGFTLERLSMPDGEYVEYWFGNSNGSTVDYDIDDAAKVIDAFIKEEESPYWGEAYGKTN